MVLVLPVCRDKGRIEDQSNDHEIHPDDGGRIFNHREVGLRQADAASDADTDKDVDLHGRHHVIILMVVADKSHHDHVSRCV